MRKVWFLLLIAIAYFIADTLYQAGVFKSIDNQIQGEVVGIYREAWGPEDIDLDEDNGLLFVSSTDRWRLRSDETVQGDIYLLVIDSGQSLTKIPHTYSGEFHPHGISYLKVDSTGLLFVVNHNYDGDFVERFRFERDTLFHEASYQDDLMCCPNDVVGVAKDQFYVTNDHGSKEKLARMMEDYLRIGQSSVLYYDGEYFSKVVDGVSYANGINLSNDGNQLYLTLTTAGEMLTFDRFEDTGDLELVSTLNLLTGVDNIHVDPEGGIWIGAHPKLLDFVGHSADSTKKSPSQVLLVRKYDGGHAIQEIYLNDGNELSGSSVAVPYKDEIFVGVVFENKVLRGKIN